ncbi:hypothetical protein [Roseomonas fluvialis]|nr:hypothetical protein [Roseomonas fluvialis]
MTVIALGIDAARHWLSRSPANVCEALQALSLVRTAAGTVGEAIARQLTGDERGDGSSLVKGRHRPFDAPAADTESCVG